MVGVLSEYQMIETIHLANEGSYDDQGALLDGLKDVNFIFGANGAGKTTISRVVHDVGSKPKCSITWKNGVALDTRVYNRDFVRDHFDENSNIKGIYTFGSNVEVAKEVEKLNTDRTKIENELTSLRQHLQGGSGKIGKRQQRDSIDEQLKKDLWEEKKKYNDLKDAFAGSNNDGARFRDNYLEMVESNTASLRTLDELREAAKTVFASDLTEEKIIEKPNYSNLIIKETDAILEKKVIGKDDVDIAALIVKLSNSDWVRQGREYLKHSESACPFCQQDVPPSLQDDLRKLF